MPEGAPLPPFDVHCPMLSLPLAVGFDDGDAAPGRAVSAGRSDAGRGLARPIGRPRR